jgi:hypothetical protein
MYINIYINSQVFDLTFKRIRKKQFRKLLVFAISKQLFQIKTQLEKINI